jgi:hypothetical protein
MCKGYMHAGWLIWTMDNRILIQTKLTERNYPAHIPKQTKMTHQHLLFLFPSFSAHSHNYKEKNHSHHPTRSIFEKK